MVSPVRFRVSPLLFCEGLQGKRLALAARLHVERCLQRRITEPGQVHKRGWYCGTIQACSNTMKKSANLAARSPRTGLPSYIKSLCLPSIQYNVLGSPALAYNCSDASGG